MYNTGKTITIPARVNETPDTGGQLFNNRDGMLEKLIYTLRAINREVDAFALALLYIDGLTYANSVYGYYFHREMTGKIYQTVRSVVRADDIIGWLHQDTFVITLPGCSRASAKKRLSQGNNNLSHLGSNEPFAFCYGIVENSELEYEDSKQYADLMLGMAEKRLHEEKLSRILSCSCV